MKNFVSLSCCTDMGLLCLGRHAHLSVIVTGSDFLWRNIFLLCSTGGSAALTAVPWMHSAEACWAACWWCVKGLNAQLGLVACCQTLMCSPLHLGAATRHLLKHSAWVQLWVLFLVLFACSQLVLRPQSGLSPLYSSIWKVHVLLIVFFQKVSFFPFGFLWMLPYQFFDPWNKQGPFEVDKPFHVGNISCLYSVLYSLSSLQRCKGIWLCIPLEECLREYHMYVSACICIHVCVYM